MTITVLQTITVHIILGYDSSDDVNLNKFECKFELEKLFFKYCNIKVTICNINVKLIF